MSHPTFAVPGQTTMAYHQQPGQIHQDPTPATPYFSKSYNGHSGRATGWIQLCCAIGMLMVGVAQFLLGSVVRFFAMGIWASLLCYGPAGILGIASFRKRKSVISAYITMSILSAIIAFFMMLVGAISAPIGELQPCYSLDNNIPCQDGLKEGRTSSDVMMACIGLIEMVVAIIGSAFGCSGVCCDQSSPPPPTTTQEITAVNQYPVVASTQQSVSDVHTDRPPPYTAILQQQGHHQQQNQNLIPQQQNLNLHLQQTHQPQQMNVPHHHQTFQPQQMNVPHHQQTFPQQQIIASQQPPQQLHPQQTAYQPLIYPNNQGRHNSGLTVNLR